MPAVLNKNKPTSRAQLDKLGIKTLKHFKGARDSFSPAVRLEETRQAALNFREWMLSRPEARYYESINLIRVPYPTRYGLLNAARVFSPYMHIMNRLFIIQFKTPAGLKTLLFSPSDIEGNRETPFFKRLSTMFGPFQSQLEPLFAPTLSTVEQALQQAGITPEQVDYISYDHLHTQDLRKWLGSGDSPGYFPNAKLLVMKQEWESTLALTPPQMDWYCPNGLEGVPTKKVILLESSVSLGEGVALVQTPGHTEGNHSLVCHTPDGLMVSSENGVSADSYAPLHSRIRGVRDYAKQTGMEVILNGNTLEGGLNQYISMVMEKTIAGPSKRNPDFYNFVPSSELTPYWAFPGLKPAFSFGPLKFG